MFLIGCLSHNHILTRCIAIHEAFQLLSSGIKDRHRDTTTRMEMSNNKNYFWLKMTKPFSSNFREVPSPSTDLLKRELTLKSACWTRCWKVLKNCALLWSVCCFIWRGVRSDVQLSCTETQFQKCSQSGKNGSKHPMLSISYNAKNKKKH